MLEAGHVQVLEGDGGRLVITVLNETKTVDGVETRVVEERETDKDQLIEVSRNYFAIQPAHQLDLLLRRGRGRVQKAAR